MSLAASAFQEDFEDEQYFSEQQTPKHVSIRGMDSLNSMQEFNYEDEQRESYRSSTPHPHLRKKPITHKIKKTATPPKRGDPYTPPKPTKRKSVASNAYANTIKSGQFEEMAKVLKIADEKKYELKQLQQKLKEIKLEDRKKDRIIDQLQREIREGPDYLHNMSDELRVVKCERRNLQDRIKIMERQALLNTDQMLRMQETNNKLTSLLKSKKMQNAGQLRDSLNNLSTEVSMREQEVVELQRTIVHVENEKAMEIKQWKTRYQKIQKAKNELTSDHNDLRAVLKNKERKIAALSIYSLSTERIKHSEALLHHQSRPDDMSPEPPALTREVSRPADVETHEEPEEVVETHKEVVESKKEQQIIVDNQHDDPTEEENVAVNPEEKTEDPVIIDEIKVQDQEVAAEEAIEQPESSPYIEPTQSDLTVETIPQPKEQSASPHKPNLFKPIPIARTTSDQSEFTESLESLAPETQETINDINISDEPQPKSQNSSPHKPNLFKPAQSSSPHKPNLFKPIPMERTTSYRNEISESIASSPAPETHEEPTAINQDDFKLQTMKAKLASLEKIKSFEALEEKSALKMEIMKLESSLMGGMEHPVSSGDIYKPAFASALSMDDVIKSRSKTRSAPSIPKYDVDFDGDEEDLETEFV